MNNTTNVSKYIFSDFKKAMKYYYATVFTLIIIMIFSYIKILSKIDTDVNLGGFGLSSVIFLFILGLNSFKSNFKFMQANNISRKRFYISSIIALLAVSTVVAFIEVTLNNLLNLVIPYSGWVENIYKSKNFIADFIWSFALFTLSISIGWFTTTLYYKCDKIMKIIISILPIILFVLLGIVDSYSNGAVGKSLSKFTTILFDLSNLRVYIAAINLMVISAGIIGLCYLLIRRISIKD